METFGFSQERTIYRHSNIYHGCSHSQGEAVRHILQKSTECFYSSNALSRVCWRNQILKRTTASTEKLLTSSRRRFGDSLGKCKKLKGSYSLQRLIHSQTLRLTGLHQTIKQGWSLLEPCIRKIRLILLRLPVIKQTQIVIISRRRVLQYPLKEIHKMLYYVCRWTMPKQAALNPLQCQLRQVFSLKIFHSDETY